jgi:hypothetical protein
LNHDASTIAGLGVSSYGAAVFKILENAQAIINGAVAFDIVDVGDKANAAGIMLVAGMIQPMGLRQPLRQHMK